MPLDLSALQNASLLAFVIVFAGGVVTSIGPCNVAMVPLIVGYVGQSRNLSRARSFTISFVFALGLAITFMSLGVAAALVGGLIGGTSRVFFYVAAAVCIIAGLATMGVIRLPMPMWFTGLRERVSARGVWGALILGLLSGLVASQCATPVLAAVLTYIMVEDSSLVYGAALLFVYALGRGVPVVAAGTFTGALKQLQVLGRWSPIIERITGGIIVAVGLYFIWIA